MESTCELGRLVLSSVPQKCPQGSSPLATTASCLVKQAGAGQKASEEHAELRVSLSTGTAQEGCRHLHAPHFSAASGLAASILHSFLSLSKTLLLGSVQVKYSHCVKFGVGISTRLLSARCHVHSTSTAEARSSARYFSVPSKGPSP